MPVCRSAQQHVLNKQDESEEKPAEEDSGQAADSLLLGSYTSADDSFCPLPMLCFLTHFNRANSFLYAATAPPPPLRIPTLHALQVS